MNAYFIELVRKHGSHGIIIDTNLLLLYLVGVYDLSFIAKFKRTRKYSIEDFNAVSGLAENFRELVTTPQILAEISNLSFQMPESKIGKYFTCLVGVLEKAREHYVEKNQLIRSNLLARIGFTDVSIIEAAKQANYLVLTDDLKAAGYLQASRCDVINLNHIRTIQWFGSTP